MAAELEFDLVPSVTGFFESMALVSLIVGPVGSTKTTAALAKIAYCASKMAPCKDGVRRSRCVWVRNTREQLSDTSIPDFLKWYEPGVFGVFEKTERRFTMRFDDVECEVLFRGLDDEKDVRRLLSMQMSFIVFDEFREIHQRIFEQAQTRVGRYPDSTMVPHRPEWGVDKKGHPIAGCVTDDGTPNKHVWGASNPPDVDTFWEDYLSNPPVNADVFIQPSGMSDEADWLAFLPANYYEDLIEGKRQDWVDVYVHAKFGRSLAGLPVFGSFRREYHVSKQPLRPILNGLRTLVVGMDFGLNPSTALLQLDPMGRLLVLAEATSESMGVQRFCREKLRPLIASRFGGAPILIVGDPAGTARSQNDEKSVYEILKAEGFAAQPAHTNSIVARIDGVESFLGRSVDGGPGMLIDPSCRMIIEGMSGKYRFKLKKTDAMRANIEEHDDVPEKNKWSHVMDGLQYGCMHADGATGVKAPRSRRVKTVSALGWT